MGRRLFLAVVFAVTVVTAGKVYAEDAGAGVWVPSFDVRLSMGFNYDLLRPLTNVDFTRPMGYFGLNIPIPIGGNLEDILGEKRVDKIFSENDMFKRPDNFRPNASADQSTNYTVRVDVPMLGGVGTFAYTQNFFFNFGTAIGGTNVINEFQNIDSLFAENKTEGVGDMSGYLSLKGALRIPLDISMGWETMTFGYAYRVNNSDDLVLALNLHRHLFSTNTRMRADIDLLGHVKVDATDVEVNDDVTTNLLIDEELLNFNSGSCNGAAQARYRAEAWTPSVGIKWKRFSLNSRFGLNVRAKGSAFGGFVVPRVVDIETGDIEILDKFEGFADSITNKPFYALDMLSEESGIIPRDLDSIFYEIHNDRAFRWKMPQGHTLGFDIIPDRFTVSYTKLFGEVSMKITDIVRTTKPELSPDAPEWLGDKNDTLHVDVAVKIDHILMFQLNYPSFFMNFGVCGIDVRSGKKYALSDVGLRLGDVSMVLPVLSGGVNLGTKLQLRVEADILPLPAVRTGVNYYF